MTVSEAIENSKKGDSKAFSFLFKKYNPILLNWLYTQITYSEEVEDTAQEAWLKAVKGIGEFGAKGDNFIGWLCTLAKRSYIDKKRLQRIKFYDTEDISFINNIPYQPYIEDDRVEVLRKAINESSESHKTVVMLRTYYQLPHSKITELLGINSVNTTLAIYRRAVLKLREQLTA